MRFAKVAFLIAGCVHLAASQINSFGTEFETIFPWNNGDVNSEVKVNMDFVNVDTAKNATVKIQYTEWHANNWDIDLNQKEQTVYVTPLSSTRFTFTSASVYQYLGQGVNRYPDTRVYIESDIPISVIAHNFMSEQDVAGAGDSYTVMPRSMASTSYALSLPAPASDGFAMIYFLPTAVDTKITFTVITATSSNTHTELAGIAFKSDVVMFGGPAKPFTMFVTGDAPFVIVAAMRKLPVSAESDHVDFGCFMPTPVASVVCAPNSMEEDHLTDLSTSNYFMLTPSSANCLLNVDVFGSKGTSRTVTLGTNRVQDLQEFTREEFGTNLGAHATDALFQMVRYGSYKVNATHEDGAFLDMVPSFSQFVTGTTGYVVPSEFDQITVIGDLKTKQTGSQDGKGSLPFQQIDHFGGQAYMAIVAVSKGFHAFSSEGLYTIHVSGSTNRFAYGYTASYNKQRVLPFGNTTQTTTTTTRTPASSATVAPPGPGQTTAAPPGPGQTTAAPPGPGKTTAVPPGPGKTTVAPPGPGKTTVVPPGPGETTAVPPGPGKTTAAPPGPGKTTAVPPGSVPTTVATTTTVPPNENRDGGGGAAANSASLAVLIAALIAWTMKN